MPGKKIYKLENIDIKNEIEIIVLITFKLDGLWSKLTESIDPDSNYINKIKKKDIANIRDKAIARIEKEINIPLEQKNKLKNNVIKKTLNIDEIKVLLNDYKKIIEETQDINFNDQNEISKKQVKIFNEEFEHIFIEDFLKTQKRGKLLSKAKDLFDYEKEYSTEIVSGRYGNTSSKLYLTDPVDLDKKYFIKVSVIKNNDENIKYKLFKECELEEELYYYDYGYGFVLGKIQYNYNTEIDYIKNIEKLIRLRNEIIGIKESKSFVFQKLLNKIEKSLNENNKNENLLTVSYNYSFPVSIFLKIDPSGNGLKISEDKLFIMSKKYCDDDTAAKDFETFKVSSSDDSTISYINHGFTGSFIVLNDLKDDDSEKEERNKKIEGIHNFLYFINSILLELSEKIQNQRKQFMEKSLNEKFKIKIDELKYLRDLSDVMIFESHPTLVCGTILEYKIYGKAWENGGFAVYGEILENQSEYLSKSIIEIDNEKKEYQNDETNEVLLGVTIITFLATSLTIITFDKDVTKIITDYQNISYVFLSITSLSIVLIIFLLLRKIFK
jgi:hypothetical protein